MLIIPISEEEKKVIERNLDRATTTSYVASVLLFSTSPLISPKRRHSMAETEANFVKQELIDKLETVIDQSTQQHDRYEALQTKIRRFNRGCTN